MGFSNQQQEWINQFIKWSKLRNDIRATMVFGSQAKKNHNHADEWSDIDIAIITSKPGLYTKSISWMYELSPMWAGLVDTKEDWGGVAAASGFSVYKGGLIVDFVILPKLRTQIVKVCIQLLNLRPKVWHRTDNPIIELCNELLGFFRRGVIVLFDKDGLTEKLGKVAETIPEYFQPPPSAEEFQIYVDNFWIDPPRVVASLQRGKLVWAMRCTRPIMKQLYKMAEWHTRSNQEWDRGTEYSLKMIEKWADPCLADTLPRIYAHYDYEDMWKALLEMMRLYRQLAMETAYKFGYDCDMTTANNVSEWIHKCYQER